MFPEHDVFAAFGAARGGLAGLRDAGLGGALCSLAAAPRSTYAGLRKTAKNSVKSSGNIPGLTLCWTDVTWPRLTTARLRFKTETISVRLIML